MSNKIAPFQILSLSICITMIANEFFSDHKFWTISSQIHHSGTGFMQQATTQANLLGLPTTYASQLLQCSRVPYYIQRRHSSSSSMTNLSIYVSRETGKTSILFKVG